MVKNREKPLFKTKKNADYPINKPVNTRDTAVRVRGVSRCTKNQNRTRFGNTAGLPIPVLNPNWTPSGVQYSTTVSLLDTLRSSIFSSGELIGHPSEFNIQLQ
jgi:hypothetical protein